MEGGDSLVLDASFVVAPHRFFLSSCARITDLTLFGSFHVTIKAVECFSLVALPVSEGAPLPTRRPAPAPKEAPNLIQRGRRFKATRGGRERAAFLAFSGLSASAGRPQGKVNWRLVVSSAGFSIDKYFQLGPSLDFKSFK